MPKYGHQNTGFGAANAAMASQFARNGGIMGMFTGSPEEKAARKQSELALKLQQMMGDQALAQGKQRGDLDIEKDDAKAQNDILKFLDISREDLKDPIVRQRYEAAMQLRMGSGLADSKVKAEMRGVEGAKSNPGYDSAMKEILRQSERSTAAMPRIAADKAAQVPANTTGRDVTDPALPINLISPQPTTLESETIDPNTGFPVKTSASGFGPPKPIPTARELSTLEADLAAKRAMAPPAPPTEEPLGLGGIPGLGMGGIQPGSGTPFGGGVPIGMPGVSLGGDMPQPTAPLPRPGGGFNPGFPGMSTMPQMSPQIMMILRELLKNQSPMARTMIP